jgi:hypothetical protein
LKGDLDTRKPNARPADVSKSALAMQRRAAATRGSQMHKADWLLRGAAVGAGDAGDGDGDIGVRMRERTGGHGAMNGTNDDLACDRPWRNEHGFRVVEMTPKGRIAT